MIDKYKKTINLISDFLTTDAHYSFITNNSLKMRLNNNIKEIKILPKLDENHNLQQIQGMYRRKEKALYINEELLNNIDKNGNIAVFIHETYHSLFKIRGNSFFDEGQIQTLTYETIYNTQNNIGIKAGYIPQMVVNKLLKSCVGANEYNKIAWLTNDKNDDFSDYINTKMKSTVFYNNLSQLTKIYHCLYYNYNKTKPYKDEKQIELANKIIINVINMIIFRKVMINLENDEKKVHDNVRLNEELNGIFKEITSIHKYNINFDDVNVNYFASQEYCNMCISHIQNVIRQIKDKNKKEIVEYSKKIFITSQELFTEYYNMNKVNSINHKKM